MRNNQPVTQRDTPLRDGCTIVSKTDAKGRITYVNDDFIDVSGFSETELIGKAHNIVRHPDMPEAAYADLWRTIQAGRPWTGTVKNRCKNGDHYWVIANVTPIREGDAIAGYMSVRTPATPEQVRAAETVYADIRAGRGGFAIVEGRARRTGVAAVAGAGWRRVTSASLVAKSGAIAALALAASLGAALSLRAGIVPGVAASALALLAALAFGVAMVLDIDRRLHRAVEGLERFAQGRFDAVIDAAGTDSPAQVLLALKRVQTRLGFEIAEGRRLAAATDRVRKALDVAATNIMIADADYNIVYANEALRKMMKECEPQMREALPKFDASKLVGESIDQFHANPARQREMLDRLTAQHRASLRVGGRHLELSINPVFDESRRRIGTVTEWVDHTAEVLAAQELESVIEGAARGDFGRRLSLEGKSDFYRKFSEGMNRLLDTASVGLEDIGRILNALSRGDLTERIDGDYEGTWKRLKDDCNVTVETLGRTIAEVRGAADAL
ncbi:MAG TPA: PAS domain S-box protein, partial [Burkholderiaceae bacterium]|nr:PAS domain S-box protein [Burkholderiaceae bacterium]